jgi:hypothetical protein
MNRSVLLAILIALVGTAIGGCGEDASDADDSSGDGGASDSGPADNADTGTGGGAGSGSTSPAPGGSGQSVACGSSTCTAPGGGFAMACCAEESSGTCGMSVMGGACSKPVAGDERCPPVSIMGAIMLPSCCTPEGLCGIDPSMFGMPGCVDLKSAAERSGMSGMMGGGIAITFPEPRSCDGADGDGDDEGDDGDDDGDDDADEGGDGDAGTEDDAGI